MTTTLDTRLSSLPTATGTGLGQGILIPIFKALNHATTVLTHDQFDDMADDLLESEMIDLANHLSTLPSAVPTWVTSQVAQSITILRELAPFIIEDVPNWDREAKIAHFKTLTASFHAVIELFDKELFGARTAEAGDRL